MPRIGNRPNLDSAGIIGGVEGEKTWKSFAEKGA
jgi:hypothetical protein